MNYGVVLGALAVVIGFIGYVPYFRNIFRGKTKPHAFSWLVWGVLTAIAFAGQIVSRAGPGAWVTGFTALVCFVIFALALKKGTRSFPLVDWLALLAAGVSLLFWLITNGPLVTVILVSIIDTLGFIPTFRKSYSRPNEETAFTYLMSSLKFALGVVALQHFSAITVLYPVSLIIVNSIFVVMLAVRRTQLKSK